MYIPRFWAKADAPPSSPGGRSQNVSCWKWSDVSLADAKQRADARIRVLIKKFLDGLPLDHYHYSYRPLREEIIQTIAGSCETPTAVITRNLYGSLILNSSTAMFIDVDFPKSTRSFFSFFTRLFSKPPATPSPQDQALDQIQSFSDAQPDLALRIYRTFAGLRCLVTNRTFDPKSDAALDLLRAANSDPLYIRLCKAQRCFRARLTPKPWRCALPVPPTHYPFPTPDAESKFRKWQSTYETATPNFTVCQLLKQLGPTTVHPDIQPILTLHDQYACANPQQPLA